jgi:hypothetical protein
VSAGFSLADAKTQARRDLHSAAAVPAVYTDDTLDGQSFDLTVRWHTKLSRNGASDQGFDATIIEGIERLVFSSDELACQELTLIRGGTVTITWPTGEISKFELDNREPQDGPINVYWGVVKQL